MLQIRLAVQFLDDLGTVQYFDTEVLRDRVVINPQWIVDVMAKVVSVNEKSIKVRLWYTVSYCKQAYITHIGALFTSLSSPQISGEKT